MKKRMLAAALILGAAAAGPALAVDQTINLNANVAAYCTLGAVGGGGSTYNITVTNGAVSGTHTATIPVECNAASSITLTSTNGAVTRGGGLQSGLPAPPAGFRNAIEFTAAASGAGLTSVSLDTNSGAGPAAQGPTALAAAAVISTISVLITPSTGAPLIAGAYSDVLTISVTSP